MAEAVISVEDAIQSRYEAAGFIFQNARLFGDDRVIFPDGYKDAQFMSLGMLGASVYTWRASMQRIVDAAHEEYPMDTAKLAMHHFHTPSMFWLCEQPIMMVRNHGTQTEHSIDAVWITAWRNSGVSGPKLYKFKTAQEVEKDATGVQCYGMNRIQGNQPVAIPTGFTGHRPTLYTPIIAATMEFGCDLSDDHTPALAPPGDLTVEQEVWTLKKWILTAAGLLKQRILTAETQAPLRHERKRLERACIPVSDVRAIALRASTSTSKAQGDNHVDWSHRWTVRGHWRNQWYPSQEEHRIVYIPSYIKGPSDKPLVVSPSVFDVCR